MLVSRLAILNTVFFLPCWGGNDVGDVDIEAEIEVELMDLMSFWRRKGLGVVLSLALRLRSMKIKESECEGFNHSMFYHYKSSHV
ncbi:hypothetical protein V6N13_005717 [Hibiscus sabdariffa]